MAKNQSKMSKIDKIVEKGKQRLDLFYKMKEEKPKYEKDSPYILESKNHLANPRIDSNSKFF
jgi:hypothetical protein